MDNLIQIAIKSVYLPLILKKIHENLELIKIKRKNALKINKVKYERYRKLILILILILII